MQKYGNFIDEIMAASNGRFARKPEYHYAGKSIYRPIDLSNKF